MSEDVKSATELDLSIIIPAYNEEGAIADVIVAIHELGLKSYEVLVIDDGSSDATARVAEAAGARVISHPYNIGNGASVKTGIRAARGKVLCFLDADGQHDPADIPRLLEHISRYHMVVGARKRGSETSLHRDIANIVYNLFASFVAEFKIEDLTSGFRAMRRRDALRFCDMFPNRFSYPTTSTLAFIRSGRSVKYVPINTKRRVGKSKIKLLHDGFEFLIIIMKIAMSFSPLRVFIPVSSFLFFLGLGRWIYTYLLYSRFTNLSQLLMNSAVIIFMLGLVAEQIASIRLEKGDRLFDVERPEDYSSFDSVALEAKSITPPASEEATH
ncbi:MAG: glycosyltransferase family 2 protein [Candidatus Dadabacteria bacterium]|nr:MAG: glycosyltransferase family 2 protein [Candidatus Dadabacteria bacterium]